MTEKESERKMRMNKKIMTFGFIFLMMFMMPIDGSGDITERTYEWILLPGESRHTSQLLRVEDSVHFYLTLDTGDGFTFLIVDTENFNKWEVGDTFSSYFSDYYTLRGDVIFKPPYEDRWYFVVSVADSDSVYVDMTLEMVVSIVSTITSTTTNSVTSTGTTINPTTLFIIFIGVVGAVCLAVMSKKRKQESV